MVRPSPTWAARSPTTWVKNTAEPVRNVPSAVANSNDCVASRRDSGVGGTRRRREGPRRGTVLWDQVPPTLLTWFVCRPLASAHAQLLPGRRVLRRAAEGEPGRGRARRRGRGGRGDAAVRRLDQPLRDHVPTAADQAGGRLPAADLHPERGAAVRRPPDDRQCPRLAGGRGSAPRPG